MAFFTPPWAYIYFDLYIFLYRDSNLIYKQKKSFDSVVFVYMYKSNNDEKITYTRLWFIFQEHATVTFCSCCFVFFSTVIFFYLIFIFTPHTKTLNDRDHLWLKCTFGLGVFSTYVCWLTQDKALNVFVVCCRFCFKCVLYLYSLLVLYVYIHFK